MFNLENKLPEEFMEILPAETAEGLREIYGQELKAVQRAEKVDELLNSLPGEVLDKIPEPPAFAQLRQEVKDRIKQIFRQKDKSYGQKHDEYLAYVQLLPRDQKEIFMRGSDGFMHPKQ